MPEEDNASEAIEVEYQQFVTFAEARNKEDAERASSAGESRQKIGEFLEKTGVNSQALSWCRTILKKKKLSQQMDVLNSLDELLPMVRARIDGGQGEMFPNQPAAEQEPVEPASESDLMGHNGAPEDDDEEPEGESDGVPGGELAPEDDGSLAEEVDAFEKHLAEVEAQSS